MSHSGTGDLGKVKKWKWVIVVEYDCSYDSLPWITMKSKGQIILAIIEKI